MIYYIILTSLVGYIVMVTLAGLATLLFMSLIAPITYTIANVFIASIPFQFYVLLRNEK
jgi:hypothetical protein